MRNGSVIGEKGLLGEFLQKRMDADISVAWHVL